MKISLITVTMGREAELARLKASLAVQTYRNFEHIVVDHRVHPEFGGSLSRARNYGLDRASGDIVAFADDDIRYEADMLSKVVAAFSDERVDGVSYRVTDEAGRCSAGWMGTGREVVSRRTVWHTIVSVSFFVRRRVIGDIRFDERLGVGASTRFGSGEETDFALRLLAAGARLVYDGRHAVIHPQFSGRYTWRRGWLYGNGYGFVLRRHGYSVVRLAWGVGTQLVRMVEAVFKLNASRAIFHLAMAIGRVTGYAI